jgi:hypothetical protein
VLYTSLTQLKVANASLSAPASTQKVGLPSPPALGLDDDHVEICSMLGVPSKMSSSSSSSSDSLASVSTRAPQLNPDMAISCVVVIPGSKLPVIPEMLELDMAQSKMEQEGTWSDALHGAGGSAGMFLNKLKLHFLS